MTVERKEAADHKSAVLASSSRVCDASQPNTCTDTRYNKRTCIQVTVPPDNGRKPLLARFGGIPLRYQRNAA